MVAGERGISARATVSDEAGSVLAHLAGGARLPLVIGEGRFSAGSTTYELSIAVETPLFAPPVTPTSNHGETATLTPTLNHDQRLLLLALTERALRSGTRSVVSLPTSSEAAARRLVVTRQPKADYLCQKLARMGVRGLHGAPDQLAATRRFSLVEYALATQLVIRRSPPARRHAAVGSLGELLQLAGEWGVVTIETRRLLLSCAD